MADGAITLSTFTLLLTVIGMVAAGICTLGCVFWMLDRRRSSGDSALYEKLDRDIRALSASADAKIALVQQSCMTREEAMAANVRIETGMQRLMDLVESNSSKLTTRIDNHHASLTQRIDHLAENRPAAP